MTLPRLNPPRLFSPPPYEGADIRAIRDDWRTAAESHLRGVVQQQRAHAKWLEGELARTQALIYQAVGE